MGREVYTGDLLQRELLGVPDPKKLAAKPERFRDVREWSRRISDAEAMRLAREMQPEDADPSEPKPQFARDLHYTIADHLKLTDQEGGIGKLRFFTAIGSPLDFKGVDAFFDLTTKFGVLTVTIDVTANPHKDESGADLVFYIDEEALDVKYNRAAYDSLLEQTTEDIIRAFRLKLKALSERKKVA